MAERAGRAGPVGRRAWSVRARITAVASAIVALLLGIGAVGTVWMMDRVLTEQIAAHLVEEADALADAVEERGAVAIGERQGELLVALHTGDRVVVNDDDAQYLPAPTDVRGWVEAAVGGDPVLVFATDTAAGELVVGRSTEQVGEAVAAATAVLAVSVPIAVAVIALILWFVVSRALGPVDRIRRQVDGVSVDSLDQRVPRTGNGDEIDSLAATMNRMLARVEEGYLSSQRFVSDASHELRSPLATMRQYAELASTRPEATSAEELAEVVLDEGARMQDIVEGLLLLAKLDEGSGRAAASSDVDFDDLALHEVGRIRDLSDISVDGSGIAPARVIGDQRLLARATRNLVDNALRHARSRISLNTGVKRGIAILCVDDDGLGVPESERERVFERFNRLDLARSRDAGGSGLGLAIVSEIVRAHGGAVRVETSPLGGARFAIFVPAAPEEDEPRGDF